MKCCLCTNTDNLLIQVQAGSGLTLHLCHEHENTPLFEVAARLEVEISAWKQLSAQHEAEIARLRAQVLLLTKVLEQLKVWSDREECCCHELIDEALGETK